MDEEQQFLFDVNGYIVLEDVSRQRSFALAPWARSAVPRAPLLPARAELPGSLPPAPCRVLRLLRLLPR